MVRSPQSAVRIFNYHQRAADRGLRIAIASYCVFVPLVPPVIGVTTTFRNHTTS
jgi:hypothetical protein